MTFPKHRGSFLPISQESGCAVMPASAPFTYSPRLWPKAAALDQEPLVDDENTCHVSPPAIPRLHNRVMSVLHPPAEKNNNILLCPWIALPGYWVKENFSDWCHLNNHTLFRYRLRIITFPSSVLPSSKSKEYCQHGAICLFPFFTKFNIW